MLKYGMFERDREQQTPKFYYNYDKTLAFCEIQLNILFKGAMEYRNLRAKYQLRLEKNVIASGFLQLCEHAQERTESRC